MQRSDGGTRDGIVTIVNIPVPTIICLYYLIIIPAMYGHTNREKKIQMNT